MPSPTSEQISYIIYTIKSNKWQFQKEINKLFPPKIENSMNTTYIDLERKIAKLDRLQISSVIGMLKDDLILEGFKQLKDLINQ